MNVDSRITFAIHFKDLAVMMRLRSFLSIAKYSAVRRQDIRSVA